MGIEISNYIWLVQNRTTRREELIAPKQLGSDVRQQADRKDIKVLYPLQDTNEQVVKLLEVDIPDELGRDPNAIFVINQPAVDADALERLISVLPEIMDSGSEAPSRVIICGYSTDELFSLFTEAVNSRTIQITDDEENLVGIITDLISKLDQSHI